MAGRRYRDPPDDVELARCIHKAAAKLERLLRDVALKYPGKQGEAWANTHLKSVTDLRRELGEFKKG